MKKFNTDGIVLKTSVTGESDLVVHVLTTEYGIIRAFAKGARNTKSRLHAATALFAFCDFTFYEKNGVYHINEAQIKELFFNLRNSLEALASAQYFCEILKKTMPDGYSDGEILRLLLNSLYFLCSEKKSTELIKSVFELRYCTLSGYMPSLVACDECGEFESDIMYFDASGGKLFCKNCGEALPLRPLPMSVISAMRHVVFSPFEKIFSFEIKDEAMCLLCDVSEKYLTCCFQQKFNALDFLSELKNR